MIVVWKLEFFNYLRENTLNNVSLKKKKKILKRTTNLGQMSLMTRIHGHQWPTISSLKNVQS